MEALRIIKKVEQTDLKELFPYIGRKVEIIVLPIEDDDTVAAGRSKFFEIVERCSGHIEPWKREDIYEEILFWR